MTESPTTRVSLLMRLRDRTDGDAWAEFVDLYAPLVYALGRRHGLQDADAADLTQEVLRTVARVAGRFAYDPARGSFRGWLLTVARNQLRKWLQGRHRQPPLAASHEQQPLDEYPAPEEDEAAWEAEYRERLFTWAADRARPDFRPTTWEAFWRTAVQERDPQVVAAELGVSVGAVYIARSRVLARLREHIRQVEEENQ